MRSRRRRSSLRRRRRSSPRRYRGPVVVRVVGDGNCLFRSLAYPSMHHAMVRSALVEHVSQHWCDDYESFVDHANRDQYVSQMKQNGTWGDEIMLAAFAKVYGRTVIVYAADATTEISRYGNGRRVTRVVFSGGHYDALW